MVSTVSNTESNSSVGDSCEACYRTTCEPTQVAITAIKPDRKYTLDLSKPLPEGESNYVLRVLAKSDTPRIIDISLKGNCKQGHGGSSPNSDDYDNNNRPNSDHLCPTAIICSNGIDVEQPSPIKVALIPKKQDAYDGGFKGFIDKYLLPNTLTAAKYPIRTHTCAGDGDQSCVVEVFPEASWTGDISFGYQNPTFIDKSLNEKSNFKNMKNHGKFVLEGKLLLSINNESWKIGGSIGEDDNRPFNALLAFLENISPFFSDLQGSKEELINDTFSKQTNKQKKNKPRIDIKWPQVTFGGGLEVVETHGSAKLDLDGKIKLHCSPLIGADINVDILQWVLRLAAPGYSRFLDRVRDILKEGIVKGSNKVNADIGIDMEFKGQVDGKLDWTKEPDIDWATKGELVSSVELKIKGYATVEVDTFIVKIVAGAGAHLGSDKSASAGVGFIGSVTAKNIQEKPGFDGSLQFSGAAIYYTKFIKGGVLSADSNEEKMLGRNLKKSGFSGNKKKIDIEKKAESSKKLITLLESFSWPDTDDRKAYIGSSSV